MFKEGVILRFIVCYKLYLGHGRVSIKPGFNTLNVLEICLVSGNIITAQRKEMANKGKHDTSLMSIKLYRRL